MPLVLIPFAIFFACCVAQFFFLERVKRALAARHPDELQGLLGKSFFSFSGSAIAKFAWQRRDLNLNDRELTKVVKEFKLLMFIAYGAWGLVALAIVTGIGQQTLSLHWLLGQAGGPSVQPEAANAAANTTGSVMTPALDVMFPAAFAVNLIYLLLAWRLSVRWNSIPLGGMATLGDPLAVLGIIWWSAPATRDEQFLWLRAVTRTVFVLGVAATLAVFALAFSTAR